jgi:hypothetical protein
VEGTIDGEHVWARWDPDAGTVESCHPEVLRRAEVVVALGDTFLLPDDGRIVVEASLQDGALPALLTFVRAIGHVTSVDLRSPRQGHTAGAHHG